MSPTPQWQRQQSELYQSLWDAGVECLYDDRTEETAGVKFNDADLLGLPLRLVVSKRSLKTGSVEVRRRGEKDSTLLPIEGIEQQLRALLAA